MSKTDEGGEDNVVHLVTKRELDLEDAKLHLLNAVAEHIAQHGGDLAGFALVTWNTGSDCLADYSADAGAVTIPEVPGVAQRALNWSVAQDTMRNRYGGDD